MGQFDYDLVPGKNPSVPRKAKALPRADDEGGREARRQAERKRRITASKEKQRKYAGDRKKKRKKQ